MKERMILHSYSDRRDGFSLIELLVVISIIALLLAILLPSLSGARQQSQSTLCLTRLRSLSQGWHMYADDNDDIAVPGRMYNQPGGVANPANWYDVGNGLRYRPRWIATMGKYVGIMAFNDPTRDVDRTDYDSKAYQCPVVPEWTDERNHAYGYNHQFLGNSRQTAGRFHNFPVNRSAIASFAGTVLAADALGTAASRPTSERLSYRKRGTNFAEIGNHGYTLDPPRLTPQSDRGTGDAGSPHTAVDARHLSKTNVIFCDGHGESMLPQAIGYRQRTDGSFVDEPVSGLERPTNTWFSGTGRDDDPPAKPTGKSP